MIKPLLLRSYQKECIDTSISCYEKGIRRMAVSLPVGSGKTIVFSNLIKRLQANCNGKTLILAHREELLNQAYNQCVKFLPNSIISFDRGLTKPDMNSDIIIAVFIEFIIIECKYPWKEGIGSIKII
jgi:ATP-dependent helicase IRC3